MEPLPVSASDDELIAFVDRWAALLEREDYDGAHALTDHVTGLGAGHTPQSIRETIKGYGRWRDDRRVTVAGVPGEIVQVKQVYRCAGPEWTEVFYSLNLDGVASDLTATFRVLPARGGLVIELEDICVR